MMMLYDFQITNTVYLKYPTVGLLHYFQEFGYLWVVVEEPEVKGQLLLKPYSKIEAPTLVYRR